MVFSAFQIIPFITALVGTNTVYTEFIIKLCLHRKLNKYIKMEDKIAWMQERSQSGIKQLICITIAITI